MCSHNEVLRRRGFKQLDDQHESDNTDSPGFSPDESPANEYQTQ